MDSGRPYRLIDHTADIGVEVWGSTREELFENCARALLDQLVDISTVGGDRTAAFSVAAPDTETLLVTFLNELLHIAEEGNLVLKSCRIQTLAEKQLAAEAQGEKFDGRKHERLVEIKTTTYHQLKITHQGRKWSTTIIFDV